MSYQDSDEHEQVQQPQRDQPWPAAFFGLFGKRLDPEEVEAIEGAVGATIRDLRPWEMTKAVRHLAMQAGKNPRKYPPSGEDIIRQIFAGRKDYAQKREAGIPHHVVIVNAGQCPVSGRVLYETRSETTDAWKAQIMHAIDPVARWAIVCAPSIEAQCSERLAFCINKKLEVDHRIPTLAEAMATVQSVGEVDQVESDYDAERRLQKRAMQHETTTGV